jgi:integrase
MSTTSLALPADPPSGRLRPCTRRAANRRTRAAAAALIAAGHPALTGLAPETRRVYASTWVRFQAFQGAHPDRPLAQQVTAFLAPLARETAVNALATLQRFLDPAELPIEAKPLTFPTDPVPETLLGRSVRTRAQNIWLHRRFLAWQAQHPELPLYTQVVTWLTTTGMSPSRQKRARTMLRHFLPENSIPWKRVPAPRYRRDKARLQRTLLTATERERVLEAARTPMARAMCWVAYAARRAEICTLTWGDIDWESGTLAVRHGKGGRSDMTVLHPKALDALQAWRAVSPTPGSERLIFPGWHGRPMRPESLSERIRRLFRRAGVARPYRGVHAFRRTFATEYLQTHRGDLAGLQTLMRHEDIAVTALYIFLQPTDLAPRVAQVAL